MKKVCNMLDGCLQNVNLSDQGFRIATVTHVVNACLLSARISIKLFCNFFLLKTEYVFRYLSARWCAKSGIFLKFFYWDIG